MENGNLSLYNQVMQENGEHIIGVITATSKKHDKIKWSESIDTGLSLPTPAVLSLFTNIYYRMIISYLSYTLIIHRVL